MNKPQLKLASPLPLRDGPSRQDIARAEIEHRRELGYHHVSEVAHTYGDALPVNETLERSGPGRYEITDAPFSPFRKFLRWLKGIE